MHIIASLSAAAAAAVDLCLHRFIDENLGAVKTSGDEDEDETEEEEEEAGDGAKYFYEFLFQLHEKYYKFSLESRNSKQHTMKILKRT